MFAQWMTADFDAVWAAKPFSSNPILGLIFRVAHPLRFSAKGGKRPTSQSTREKFDVSLKVKPGRAEASTFANAVFDLVRQFLDFVRLFHQGKRQDIGFGSLVRFIL